MQVEDSDLSNPNSLQSAGSNNDASLVDGSRRLESFLTYPPPHNVNVMQLARNGFFYAERSPNSQKVVCLGCAKEVESWNIGDDPSDQRFHNENCRFLQRSEQGSMVSNVAESLVRASVQSAEETTPMKPVEAAGTSFGSHVAQPQDQQLSGPQSLMPVKSKDVSLQGSSAMGYGQSASLPPERTTYEYTRIHKVRGKEAVTNVEHVRATREESLHPRMGVVTRTQTSLFAGSQPSYPREGSQPASIQRHPSMQESMSSYVQDPSFHASLQPLSYASGRLENPDPVEEVLANLDMRNAEHRLYTFEQYWGEENSFRNYRLLVKYGFFCLGQGDAVECFCCHLVIANWDRNDDPKQRHVELSPVCRFIRGEESGDIPLQPEPRRSLPAAPTTSRQSPMPGRLSSHSSPYQSLGHNPVAHPTPEGAAAQEPLLPSASLVERNNLFLEFPCVNPANPAMREEHARLQTLNNSAFRQNSRLRASNEELASAGMYYLGDSDRCKCWFCDGGLMDFLPDDDPWVEHAKYFPQCEFLLQQKGPAWVTAISVQNPNIQRPIFPQRENRVLPNVVSSPHPLPPAPVPLDRIEDPQQQLHMRDEILEEGMRSEPVETARQMGFTDDQIRDVQMRKIISSNCCFQTSESLVDALLNPDGIPDSPEPPSQPRNVIDMSGQTIHIRGGNFVGPSVINGRLYRQSPPDGVRTRRYGGGANVITINGRSMEEFMAEAFDDPFFRDANYQDPMVPHTFNNVGAMIRTGSSTVGTRSPSPPPAPAPSTPVRPSPSTNAGSTASTEGATASPARSNASAEERLEEIERERSCKVCYGNVADILFQPCGHICACSSCSTRLTSCPVCRRRIVRYIRTYHA